MSSYVERTLGENETISYVASLSLVPYAGLVLIGILSILSPFWHLPLITMLPGIAIFIFLYLLQNSVELAVTNLRIIAKTGVIRRSVAELYLNRVEGVDVKQSINGRILGYGTISIRGVGTEIAAIKNISAPLTFRRAFAKEIDQIMSKTSDGKGLDKSDKLT